MLWLDSTYPPEKEGQPGAARGDCPQDSGVPADVEESLASVGSTSLEQSALPLFLANMRIPGYRHLLQHPLRPRWLDRHRLKGIGRGARHPGGGWRTSMIREHFRIRLVSILTM